MHHEQSSQVSVGNWMLTLFLTFIPVVNIIMLIVWAFSSSTPPSKSNWAKAALIWMLIFIIASILFGVVGGLGVAML